METDNRFEKEGKEETSDDDLVPTPPTPPTPPVSSVPFPKQFFEIWEKQVEEEDFVAAMKEIYCMMKDNIIPESLPPQKWLNLTLPEPEVLLRRTVDSYHAKEIVNLTRELEEQRKKNEDLSLQIKEFLERQKELKQRDKVHTQVQI